MTDDNSQADTGQQMLGEAKQTAASAADAAKATVGGVADRVAATASDFGRGASEKTADIAQKAGGKLRENPLAATIAAGLVGVAIGFLLGRPSEERAIRVGRARLSYRDR